MFYLISGGSGSGKSEFAEKVSVSLHGKSCEKEFIYIATMMAFDEEAEKKIQRHRFMRRDKGFTTLECFTGLKNADIPSGCTVLLDCMSNLTANEMFDKNGAKEKTVDEIIHGVKHLLDRCENIVIVTNEIFSDGCRYDEMCKNYIKNLGKINSQLAEMADSVVEVIYGIPVYRKGEEKCFSL